MGEDLDPTVLAAVLAAEHPLIDPALISAFLSDYEPSELRDNLSIVKDQLGILEAALVADDSVSNAGGVGGEGSWAGSENGEALEVEAEDDRGRDLMMKPGSGIASLSERMGGVSVASSSTGEGGIEIGEEDLVFADEMELLTNLFPMVRPSTIHDALSLETSLEATIDHLLSLDLIRDAQERGYWPGEDDSDSGEAPPLARLAPPAGRPGRPDQWAPVAKAKSPEKKHAELASGKKKKKGKARTVPLVDTLQRRARPVSTSGRSSRSGSASGTTPSTPSSSPPPSAWAHSQAGPQNQRQHLSSIASYLAQTLPPHPASYFYGYFLSPQWASTYDAAWEALARLPRGARGTTDEDEVSRKLLMDYRPRAQDGDGGEDEEEEARARVRDLEVCVQVAGQDVAAVMDLLDLLQDLRGAEEEEMMEGELEPEEQDGEDDGVIVSVGAASGGGWAKPLLPASTLPGPVARPVKPTNPPKAARPVPGSVASTTTPNLTDTFGLAHPSVSVVPKPAQHPDNWKTVSHARPTRLHPTHALAAHIPAYARGTTPHDATPGSLSVHPQASFGSRGSSVADCLAQADAEMKRREVAIRSAVRNFSSGSKSTRGAVAGHYANQAREATARAKEWQMLASQMVVESQTDSFRHTESRMRHIDLHHLTRAEGTRVALNAAQAWWAYEGERRAEHWGPAGGKQTDGRLVVIVGAGRHSVGNKGVLGPAVYQALDQAGWRVDQGESDRGYLVVRGKR